MQVTKVPQVPHPGLGGLGPWGGVKCKSPEPQKEFRPIPPALPAHKQLQAARRSAPHGPIRIAYRLTWPTYGPTWTHKGTHIWVHMGPCGSRMGPIWTQKGPYGTHMEPVWDP